MICPTCLPPNRWSLLLPAIFSTILFCALAAFSSEALATEVASSVGRALRVEYPIQFSDETLSNGLRVIYAPLHNAPVVHVRVFYHVGSRDERSDRQGFAHMFEHMMFRGSAHVAPQEHMTLVNGVGGICNAFTSFDKTVYFDTVPAEDLEMVLYLEADRMSSFKVSQQIYQTERQGRCRRVADAAKQAVWHALRGLSQGRIYDPQLPVDADRQHAAPAGGAGERAAGFFQHVLRAQQRGAGDRR